MHNTKLSYSWKGLIHKLIGNQSLGEMWSVVQA
jgi:hypothetical protein